MNSTTSATNLSLKQTNPATNRYTYVESGSAEQPDHILYTSEIDPVVSIDYARDLTKHELPSTQARVTWIEGDFWELSAEEKFDTILLGEVIEHQTIPGRFLAAAATRLNSGGRIVLTTPFGLHPHSDHKATLLPSHVRRMAA